MPNITPSAKGGRSVDSSDLLVQKKRNIYLQVQQSKGEAYSQVENKSFGYDTMMTIGSRRGLDEYIRPKNVANVDVMLCYGTLCFEGTYDEFTLDLYALIAIIARQFGVSPSQVTVQLTKGSVIIEYRIMATITQGNVILQKTATNDSAAAFAVVIQSALIAGAIPGLTLVPGGTVSLTTSVQNYVEDKVINTLAGNSTSGLVIGRGSSAGFVYPSGITVDSNDNIYLVDSCSTLLKISSTGSVTQLATLPSASVNANAYIALDNTGKIYIKTSNSVNILRYNVDGTLDSTWNNAYDFSFPISGLTFSVNGSTMYVTNTIKNFITKVDLVSGLIDNSFVVGGVFVEGTSAGFTDGFNFQSTKYDAPTGLAIDDVNHMLFIADTNNHAIRSIDLVTGRIDTIAGNGVPGWTDGTARAALFNGPTYLAYNSSIPGYLFVSDTGNNAIRQIELSTRIVKTLAGTGLAGFKDLDNKVSQLNNPFGLALSNNGILYIADAGNYRIRTIDLLYVPVIDVTTIISTYSQKIDYMTSIGANIYFTSKPDSIIYKLDSSQRSRPVAGMGWPGFADGSGTIDARFNTDMTGLANDGFYIYAVDTQYHGYRSRIRRINSNNFSVDTIVDSFRDASGLCYDGLRYLYTYDEGMIYKVDTLTPYTVTAIAGVLQQTGYVDGPGTSAQFNVVTRIVYDGTRYLYLYDSMNFVIRRLDLTTFDVTTVAGTYNITGYVMGSLGTSVLSSVGGMDYNTRNSCLYITTLNNATIVKLDTTTNMLSQVAGTVGINATLDGSYSDCQINSPGGCTIKTNGDLVVAETVLPGIIRNVRGPLP